jgi:hypothetical protein
MNWKTLTAAIVLGLALPTSIVTCVGVETAHAQLRINNVLKNSLPTIPGVQKLQLGLPLTETETPEEINSEGAIIEDNNYEQEQKSDSSSVWNTLIQTVGDVIKTDIQHRNSQQNQSNYPETSSQNFESNGEIDSDTNTSFDTAPQIAHGDNAVVEKLSKWGWTRVGCKPELVFIYGLGNDTVCITPNGTIPAGQYQYNPATNQLAPVSAISNSTDATPPAIVGY